MYSEEIKYYSYASDDNTHTNKIRNTYFENRNCMTNILNFLDQEVIIMPSSYFSENGGLSWMLEDEYIGVYDHMEDGEALVDIIVDLLERFDSMNGYHLSILDNYITIVAQNRRCVFTNRDMVKGTIIGTIFWVKNYSGILKKYSDKNLKIISKAILHPFITKYPCPSHNPEECIENDFFLFMDVYYPKIAFKYTIDT